jgi:flagellar motor protein MotB
MRYKRTFELNYWFSVADLVLAVSMIFMLLWFVERFRNVALNNELEAFQRDKPPIIDLDEARNYTFQSGSAELSPDFKKKIIEEIIPKLTRILDKYNVDVIEVIGHTDGQPVNTKQSNLDQVLEDVVLENKPIESLVYGSNAEIGLIRAIAVGKFIKNNAEGKLKEITFNFYSAAQLIPPNGDLRTINRNDDAKRRRIEIRFTKLANNNESKQ